MSDSKKSAKALAAEETIDQYLDPSVTSIGASEEEAVLKLISKLPLGIDEKKLLEALKKLQALKLPRFANKFPLEYIPVLREAVKLYLHDAFPSRMVTQCLAFALEKDFSDPQVYEEYCQTAAFLQYLNTLSFPVDKAANFSTSDKFITSAVGEYVAQTLVTVQKQSRDIKVFNSFLYALGKCDHPLAEKVFDFQIGNDNKLTELNIFILALGPNKHLPNTAKAYQRAYDKLHANKEESLADQVMNAIGIPTEIGQKWSFKIQASSDPKEKIPKYGWFVSIAVSNMWNDCIQMDLKGPKGTAKGNQRHGVLKGKGLDFLKIDLFNLKSTLDEAGKWYGIDQFHWENVHITVTGLDRTAVKIIKNWLNQI